MTERRGNGAPEDARPAKGPTRAELLTMIEDLQRVLEQTREQSDEHLRGLQRTAADFANYRRRVDEDREGLAQFTNAILIGKLLSVLDDFDRALANVPIETHEGWVDGVRLVERKLRGLLENEGVTQIEALGKPFDPNLHEAVAQDASTDLRQGQVVRVLSAGYTFHDRVLRPATVVVAA